MHTYIHPRPFSPTAVLNKSIAPFSKCTHASPFPFSFPLPPPLVPSPQAKHNQQNDKLTKLTRKDYKIA